MSLGNVFRRLTTLRLRSRKLCTFRKPDARSLLVESLEDRLAPSAGLTSADQQVVASYDQLPLSFEANAGQTAAQVQYLSQGSGYTLFLTSTGSVLSLQQPTDSTTSTGVTLAMNLIGSNAQATVVGQDPLSGTSNYFIGNNPSQWRTNITNYSKVAYRDVFPGVNLVYYGNQQQLEYDFDVAPGTNPGVIRFSVQGAESVTLDAQGNLILQTATGNVLEHAPVLYQDVGGTRQAVSGQFVLLGAGEVGFLVGSYNASLPLVIDPVLAYSTYLGGSGGAYGTSIAVDGSGDTYITGTTDSIDFPTSSGAFQTSYGGNGDVFVTKLNAGGTALVYSTYLGGNGNDQGNGIAVDGLGDAYITGTTGSTNFPTTGGAFQTSGSGCAFVTKLNASGTALVYSTYLGGSSTNGSGIAVDGSGDAYVTGLTETSNFPTTPGAFQTSEDASGIAFVTKLNAGGTALVYSTYLGGIGESWGYGIAVDGLGDAYITGFSQSSNFPTTIGAFQTSPGSYDGNNAFATKLNASGTALIYSTLLGGSGEDSGTGIAIDGSGDAYITGYASSTNFPTTKGAFQTSHGSDDGGDNAFVTKLNASGTGLVYSTYLGGDGSDQANGIAVDGSGDAYVTGVTSSINFPTTTGAFQTSLSGSTDAFMTMLNASGTALTYSTYLGGSSDAQGNGIALDTSGDAYVTGGTLSTNFPTTTGAFQTSNGVDDGADDAFVSMFDFGPIITTTTLPNWTVNQPYSQTITTSGGTSPITFTVSAGNLPTGLMLSSTGAITGTPTTTTGSPFAFTITAIDAAGESASQDYTVTINLALSITPTSLPTATPGTPYSQTLTVSGGTTPYTALSITGFSGGTTGLTYSSITTNASTGTVTISGTPSTVGTVTFTVNVTDTVGATLTQNYTLIVGQAPDITGANSTTFTVGSSQSYSVTASGYPDPTFSEYGTLPSGVTLTSAGLLSGTPAGETGGTYPIVIVATNGVSPDALQPFTLTVDQAPAITSVNATTFTVGTPGAFTLTASGFPAPTFTETGSLPSGVTLGSDGLLSGTPAAGTGGVYSLVLTASNGVSPDATQTFSVIVGQAPAITSVNNTTFTVGSSGSYSVTATGYPNPTFTDYGSLPSGVTLSSTGLLSGTPAAGSGGDYPIVIAASNDVSPDAIQSFTLTVDQAPAFTSAPGGAFIAGTAGTFTVTATGFPTPTFAVTTGTLPSGMSLDSTTGVLSGTPEAGTGGSYSIIITATNAVTPDATQPFALTVDQAPAITSSNSTTFTVGSSGSLLVTASGYPDPTFTESGTLPSGVTLSSEGLLSGTPAGGTGGTYQIVIVATNGISPDATQTFMLSVDQAQYSLSNSFIALSSGSVQSGSTDTVTLQAEDEYGNDETTGGLTVAFALSSTNGGQGTFSSVTDNGNGTYTVTFTGTIAGSNTFTATIDGQAITSTEPSISVTPGPVSLVNSFVTLSSGSVQSGSTDTITLQGEDAAGNDETSGGLTVDFALASASGGQGTFSSVTDNGNGTYTAIFTGTIAGNNTITATINGQAITSTAPSVSVTPGPFSLEKSFITLSLPSVQLGGKSTLTLQAEDSAGNKETIGGLTVAFALGSASGGQGTISSVTDNGNGTYTATFIGIVDGSNTLVATIDGSAVASTTPTIAVTGAAFSLAKSIVTVSPGSVQSGGTTTITLQAEDAKGNKETSGGLTVAFKLGSTSGGQGTFSDVTDNGNGTYTAMFTGTIAGSNTIEATIDGQTVSTKAPTIKVTPGEVSLATSVLRLSSAIVASGSKVTVTLQPEDAAGNKLTLSGLVVDFALGTGNGRGTFSTVKYNTNGTYSARFTGTLAGGDTITATVGGQSLTTTPPVITVTSGPVSLKESFASVSSGSVISGSSITVTLQAEDAHGNLETAGNLAVAFTLGSGEGKGTFSKVKYVGNGEYQATFTGTIAGSNRIVAKIGGEQVTSTAPSVTVTPGPVSLAKSVVTLSVASIKVDGTTKVTLQARDAAGNDETSGGLTVLFFFDRTDGGQGTFTSVTDDQNGTYTAMFTGTAVGKGTITATIDGLDVTSTAPSIKIES